MQIGTTICQGQLSDAEIQLVEMSIEMAGDSPPREWLRSLHSWLASNGKPRWTAEPVENLQAQRLRRAQVYLKAGGEELGYCETICETSSFKVLADHKHLRGWKSLPYRQQSFNARWIAEARHVFGCFCEIGSIHLW